MTSDVLAYAIEHGVNYIFHSTDLHAGLYARSESTLKKFVRRSSRKRDQVILAAASYVCDAEKILGVVVDQMTALQVDYVDVFHWGWITRNNGPESLISRTQDALRSDEGRAYIDNFMNSARQVRDELRCRGYARFLGISTHDRTLALELAKNPLVDVVMFRYNLAHRGAEQQIFSSLPTNRPGTIAFNTSHDGLGPLTEPPPGLPAGRYRPSQGDLYRFALDRPEIDVVLTGPTTREHVDASLEALKREPLDPLLYEYLCKYGSLHSGHVQVAK